MYARTALRMYVAAACAALVIGGFPLTTAAAAPPAPVYLTSITVDPEDAGGTTTNAPGAWSTNTADPLCQVAVHDNDGRLLNQPVGASDIGEISIPLKPGQVVLRLIGEGVFPANPYYGAVLFFNGSVEPPMAVYSSNGGSETWVQPAGNNIMWGANGSTFFGPAPGARVANIGDYQLSIASWAINALGSGVDQYSCGGSGPNGLPDMVATLVLKVTRKK
jgi:hypothetical protein